LGEKGSTSKKLNLNLNPHTSLNRCNSCNLRIIVKFLLFPVIFFPVKDFHMKILSLLLCVVFYFIAFNLHPLISLVVWIDHSIARDRKSLPQQPSPRKHGDLPVTTEERRSPDVVSSAGAS